MTYNEFESVVKAYEAAKAKAIEECELEPVGIDIEYVNANGEEKSLTIRNVCLSSSYPGCIDADCFSYYRADEYGILDGPELDAATTSRRTFKLSRIRSASVSNIDNE